MADRGARAAMVDRGARAAKADRGAFSCKHEARAVAGANAGMARHVIFFFLSSWDGALLGVGALRKLRTLRIGSGSTDLRFIDFTSEREAYVQFLLVRSFYESNVRIFER